MFDHMIPDAYASDGASGCYFLGRKSNREISVAEIIGFYRGNQQSRRSPATNGDIFDVAPTHSRDFSAA
jgi:hypothetical protein